MRRKSYSVILTVLALLVAQAAPLRADEVATAGREILKKHQKAVVTIQIVLKVTSPSRSGETRQTATGLVVDPSGLIVTALSGCDPAEMTRRMVEDARIDTEIADAKILLDDGIEIPAEIVLRDRDQDLAFLRPKTKPSSPMTAVDLSKSAQVQALDQVITLNRLNRATGRAYSASVERISAVVSKPRTFYVPDSTMTATGLGSPVFGLNGNIVGIVVYRAVPVKGAPMNETVASIILPAEDILKASRQAPESKPDEEKKDPAK